jgi:glucose-6-phosphate isomerase
MNPSAMLALAWFFVGDARGSKNMIVIHCKERLELFSRYLQQLIMELLCKERDRSGTIVNQGISVLGNKGETDQNSYIQQLRDVRNDCFVTFLEVISDGHSRSLMVDRNTTTADYLAGFYLGTREALFEKGRDSITVTVQEVSPATVGVLIAIFEQAVGFYGSLVNIDTYHQPRVEAGKKGAEIILTIQSDVFDLLSARRGDTLTCVEIAQSIEIPDKVEHVFKVCDRLSANSKRGLTRQSNSSPFNIRYVMI